MEKQNKLSQWWEYCQQQWFIKRNGNVNSIRYAKWKSLKALAWCESKRTTQPPNHSLLSIFQLHSRAFHHFQLCYQPETRPLTLLELLGIQKNQTTNSQIFFHSGLLPPTSIRAWGVHHQECQVNPYAILLWKGDCKSWHWACYLLLLPLLNICLVKPSALLTTLQALQESNQSQIQRVRSEIQLSKNEASYKFW